MDDFDYPSRDFLLIAVDRAAIWRLANRLKGYAKVPRRKISVFYAWQSDRPEKINRKFIRMALDDAAKRITDDPIVDVEVVIDADTEGVVGTPPVTETILKKIAAADIFVPDLTFVAKTDGGKLMPNSNVMAEYGYALKALTFEAMMPIMNTSFGPPEELPFDLGHVRYPTEYEVAPDIANRPRREARAKLSSKLEDILRLMVQNSMKKARSGNPFIPQPLIRPPAFFFRPEDVLASFGEPGEQEHRFKRDRAIYLRLYPSSADQPRVGRTRITEIAERLMPLQRVVNSLSAKNAWGAINLEPHGDGIKSFTQAFESGELWGVSEEPFQSRDPHFLVALYVEVAFAATLKNYLKVYEQLLKLRPPFTIEFGATGLKDWQLFIPRAGSATTGSFAGPFLRDSVVYEVELSSFDWVEWQSALKEFLIRLYDAAERERGSVLTDEIIAANDLTPR